MYTHQRYRDVCVNMYSQGCSIFWKFMGFMGLTPQTPYFIDLFTPKRVPKESQALGLVGLLWDSYRGERKTPATCAGVFVLHCRRYHSSLGSVSPCTQSPVTRIFLTRPCPGILSHTLRAAYFEPGDGSTIAPSSCKSAIKAVASVLTN